MCFFFISFKPIPTWFSSSKAMQKKREYDNLKSVLLCLSLSLTFFLSFIVPVCVCVYWFSYYIVLFIAYFTHLTHYFVHSLLLIFIRTHFWFRTFLCWNTSKALYTKMRCIIYSTVCVSKAWFSHSASMIGECSFHFCGWLSFRLKYEHRIAFGWEDMSSWLTVVANIITISKSKSSQIIVLIAYLFISKRMFTTQIHSLVTAHFLFLYAAVCLPPINNINNTINNKIRSHDFLVIANKINPTHAPPMPKIQMRWKI